MTDRKLTSPSPIPEGAETAKGRWYIVGLLTLLYGLSFIDRMILALLAQPVALSLGLSDMQLGLLMGAGFAVVYSLAGLPIAHFVDRGNRKLIVTLGVLCWSVLTVASAFARDFSHLLVLRAGVAIGEAVLTPAAVSLIADMFPRKARAAPTAVYASMSSIMASGSFVIGAAALGLSTAIQHSTGLEPWRMTMVFVGAPGILVAAIFYFTTREPIRRMIGEAWSCMHPSAKESRIFARTGSCTPASSWAPGSTFQWRTPLSAGFLRSSYASRVWKPPRPDWSQGWSG